MGNQGNLIRAIVLHGRDFILLTLAPCVLQACRYVDGLRVSVSCQAALDVEDAREPGGSILKIIIESLPKEDSFFEAQAAAERAHWSIFDGRWLSLGLTSGEYSTGAAVSMHAVCSIRPPINLLYFESVAQADFGLVGQGCGAVVHQV